jgi:hypothetical protein
VTELRHQCKVVITLAATKQSFSLEVDLDDIEVLRKTVAREAIEEKSRSAMLRS